VEPLLVTLTIDQQKVHRVVDFELTRELSRPARAKIDIRLLNEIDPRALLGQSACLSFGYGDFAHVVHGVIAKSAAVATPAHGADHQWSMRVELVSALGLLEHRVSSRIFQNLSVVDIVKTILTEHGVEEGRQKWKLGGSYPERIYCVQYGESELDFCNRLLEKEGIFYSLRGGEDGEQVVFEDDSAGCDPLDGGARLEYVTSSGMRQADDTLHAIVDRHQVRSGKVVLRDYDFTKPDLDLTSEAEAAEHTELALYDFPGGYLEPDEGARYARVQLEAEQAERHILEVVGNSARLMEGRQLNLVDAPRGLDGDYLVTQVVHRYAAVGGSDAAASHDGDLAPETTLNVSARLLPLDIPYRHPATTALPIIEGPQTATVVAPDGAEPEEIHTDEHGRCKVKFHWDLDEALDDRASCWIRTQQLQSSGSMILPRVDWEVVVEFQQGDPDRPIITGRLYNGRYMPPYELPEGKTRTALRSSTSPGGAGANEIRFEDKAGKEEISVKAEKNQKIATGNNKTKSTGSNETQSVAANRTLDVGANQTIRVTSGYQNTVSGAQSVKVAGNRKVGVNAVLGLSAPSNATSVGGNQFEMDGNPLAGLIDLAAEKAAAAAKEKAKEAMKKLDAAVKEKLDKVMGPIDKVTGAVDKVGKGLEAAKNGDLGGVADAAREAAGLPTPTEFGNQLKDKAMGKAKSAVSDKRQDPRRQAVRRVGQGRRHVQRRQAGRQESQRPRRPRWRQRRWWRRWRRRGRWCSRQEPRTHGPRWWRPGHEGRRRRRR